MLKENGTLKETPIMKLLLTLFEQGTTGVLYLKHEDVLKVLYFNKGKLIWAISNSDEDKLENILLFKNLVDALTLRKVKKESRVSDSIGKLLVEKGLITLEELIDSSKQQLRHIMISILKWTAGSFQLIKEPPPERLLSLDLSITDFIIDYIVEAVDFPAIWKEIGTLQIEFIKNPDEKKLAKYHLSDKQMELLNSFDGENKLEGILSRHYGGHRESMLKIIYFFLMSELLIKKEFELSDAAVFDDDKGFHSGETDEFNAIRQEAVKPVEPVETVENRENPSYVFKEGTASTSDKGIGIEKNHEDEEKAFSKSKLLHGINKKDKGDVSDDSYEEEPDNRQNGGKRLIIDPIQITGREGIPGAPGNEDEKKSPEEIKRTKLLYVIFIFIFLILVISGIILLLLPWMHDDTTGGVIVRQKENRNIFDTIKKEPGVQEEKPGDLQRQDERDNLPPPANESAVKYFREGDLVNAAVVWKREVRKTGVEFSILLELDCLKESVMYAYDKIGMKKDFFLLNKQKDGKTCFLVMWGKFYTRQEAAAAIKLIPNYFWKQQAPPKIVNLADYL